MPRLRDAGHKFMPGLLLNVFIVAAVSSYLAQNTILWIALLLLNVPIYLGFARVFFSGSEDAKWSLGNLLHSDSIKATEDETWAGYRGWVYIAVCLAIVTAEYKAISWFS